MVRPRMSDREQVRNKIIQVRLRPRELKRWSEKAKADGMSLAEWVRTECNRAARM